jgi:hypothetical protein
MKAFPSQEFSHMEAEAGTFAPRPVYMHNPGMDLRDYMAAHAMQALISSDKDYKLDMIAWRAYDVADAMIKERENYHGKN